MSPFWRDLLLAAGFVDVSFRSLVAVLKRQRSVAVVIGGAAEVRNSPIVDSCCSFLGLGFDIHVDVLDTQALDAHPSTNDIILNKRKGFIRLALVTGTPIVPVFVFGESDLYFQVSVHLALSTMPTAWCRLLSTACLNPRVCPRCSR